MASFSGELRVAGHVFPLLRCDYQATQATDGRGRVAEKVRYHPVTLLLDVPPGTFLEAWAADPHKRYSADVVFLAAAGGRALETLSLKAAYCVHYQEAFATGDATTGSYVCYITLSDPGGFTLHAGGPAGAFAAPAAREHGASPVASSAIAATPTPAGASTCPPDVTARLQMQVELMCKPKGISSRCTQFDACPALLEKIALTQACIKARETIMAQCFGGGDATHRGQIEERKNGVENCKRIYKRKCGPLPESAPSPVFAPRREPSTESVDHKLDPVVPTTLVGAALLIFYIVTSALRPGPI